ncbi:MAG: hypothetical protein HRT47_00575 [Candidatus Caenarcaniphilales bacterium]|nr:hypothetical protein [Candidatus Caenarcaniphilales bacterium]
MVLGVKLKNFFERGVNSLPRVANFQSESDSKLKNNPLLKDFNSSTDDFPNLSDPRNNLAREYLEAYRFYNLPPLQDLEGNSRNYRAYSAGNNDKYQIDENKNNDFKCPISYFSVPISPRAFYRESEKLHNIDNRFATKQIIQSERNLHEAVADLKNKFFDDMFNRILQGNFEEVPYGNEIENSLKEMDFDSFDEKKEFISMAIEEVLMPNLFDNNPKITTKSKFMKLWENAPKNSPVANFRIALNRYMNKVYEEHRDDMLKPELRELVHKYFPFERFKLKPELLPRNNGLKHSLRLYLNNLKNFEPSIYEFTKNAMENLNQQKPLAPDTDSYISIAAHQSEVDLSNLLTKLSEQDFDKEKTPIYIFVNGDDQKQIDKRLSEINEFSDKLNLRIISSTFNSAYRNGLKKIPATVAAMDLAYNHDFKKSDADIVGIFLDADLTCFPDKSHIRKGIEGIKSGKFRISKGFSFDEKELANQNANLSVLHLIYKTKYKLLPYINYVRSTYNKSDYKEPHENGLVNSGGHNFYSSILKNLTGGIKAHINNEDSDWTKRASLMFMKNNFPSFYSPRHLFKAISHDVEEVVFDNGAIERTLMNNLPVIKIWDSHDEIIGAGEEPLTSVDMSEKDKVDIRRIDEEFRSLLSYVYSEFSEIESKLLPSKSNGVEKLESELLAGYLGGIFENSFKYFYQGIDDLSILEEDKSVIKEYIENTMRLFFPSKSFDELNDILNKEICD